MRILPILAVPLLLSAVPAAAQGLNRPAGGPAATPPQQQQPAANRPPPALPGLAARRAPAPIAGDPSRVMSPNEALFDAITRGDLPAARDAVSRGADLDARNVLGLTPTDAAVDQGRNEILFFLLSSRGTMRSSAPPPPALRGGSPARERAPAVRPAERAPRQAPAAPVNARLFAGDGGTPRPEIGFLGFDAGRPHGAGLEERSSRRRGG